MHELSYPVPYTMDQHGSEGLFMTGLVFGLFIGIVIGAMLRRELIEGKIDVKSGNTQV